MQVESVNIGVVHDHLWRNGTSTGFIKSPQKGMVEVLTDGLVGDEQADTENHGGPDKAVFVIPVENYPRFQIDQQYGFLGENLSISGLDELQVCLGDRLKIGSVLLEVSQPRSPCWKLGEQGATLSSWKTAGEFLDAYAESGRVGFYCRVLEEGLLKKGDKITHLPANNREQFGCLSIYDLFLAKHFHRTEQEWSLLKKAAQHPALSAAWHDALERLFNTPA